MECPYIPLTPYSDFSLRLHEQVAGKRIPLVGSLEVTERCNLDCAHCYINLPAGDRGARKRELGTDEIYRIIDQIVEEGCLWLLLTGGEPFVRPDFLEIYTYAKKKGLLVTLFTNGTTITPRIADHLAEWRPFAIEITLYGHTQETYERVTGVLDSYERCMRGIELLQERELPLKLKTMVMTLNQDEIWDMQAYASTLGVEFRFDPVLNVRLDGERAPADYRIPAEKVVALDLADEKRLKGWQDFQEQFSGPPSQPEYLYQCGAGNGSFHIDAYGQLSTCMMARFPNFDLRRGSFRTGWDDFIPQVRDQKWTRQVPCQTCELNAICDQCPGWSQIEYGDQQTPVAYLCQIAHQRADAFGLNGKNRGGIS